MSENDNIIHYVAYFMNHAEEYIHAPDKKAYVVSEVLKIFPHAEPGYVESSIRLFAKTIAPTPVATVSSSFPSGGSLP